MKCNKILILAALVGLSGCGNSHLECDTEENINDFKMMINYIISKHLEFVGLGDKNFVEHEDAYPEINITSFTQQKLDDDTKKCSYIIDAHFKVDNTSITDIPVTIVFRNTEKGEYTHIMESIDMAQGQSIALGMAAIKNNKLISKAE